MLARYMDESRAIPTATSFRTFTVTTLDGYRKQFKAAGQKVVLQQRVRNKKTWKATGTAKVKNNGTYVLKDVPSTPGQRSYRVVKQASNGFTKGISPSVSVEVYAWEKLAFRPAGPTTNLLVGSGALIATDYYGNSLVTDLAGAGA